MNGLRSGEERLRQERERIAAVRRELWRDVFLFDATKTAEHLHEYFMPNAGKSERGLFEDSDEVTFQRDNRLFAAIQTFLVFPDEVQNHLDRHWTPDINSDLEYEYTKLDCLFGNALDQVCQYLVHVAEQNAIDASAIARAGEVTIALIGKHSLRTKLWREQIDHWGHDFHPGEWPECLLKLDSLRPMDHKAIRNGKAELRRLESLLCRWRESGHSDQCGPNLPGTVTERPGPVARSLIESGALDLANRAELERHERLMREVIENERVTAGDELSRKLAAAEYEREVAKKQRREREREQSRVWVVEDEIPPPDTPRLIVRFLRLGTGRPGGFSIGQVVPIERSRAMELLTEKDPVVELATPEELKRDRDLIDAMEAIRKEWDHGQVSPEGRIVLVRFVRTGRHPKLGHLCHPGEVWKVDADTAYEMARGKEPLCELQMDTEKTESDVIGNGKGKLKKSSKTSKKPKFHAFVKALSTHHQYEEGSCLNFEPATFGQLAKIGGFAPSTAKEHIDKQFGGIEGYKRACAVKSELIASLRLLNNEVTPRLLLRAKQVDNRSRSMDVEE